MKTLSNVGARVGLRQRYNAERPHEALGQRLPASLYQASPRPYPTTLLPITYPGHYEVRRVSRNGGIRWGSRWVNVSHVLAERSEEHTSELQSRLQLVCRLLLEKKKKTST